MRKTRIYILLALMLAVLASCIKEQPMDTTLPGEDLPYPKEGKALIEMSARFPAEVATKAMADIPSITRMRVVVFGSSGFLKESVDVNVEDGYFEAANTNGDDVLYKFQVQLTLTDSKRLRVHVIANCDNTFPWRGEDEVMRKHAYTEGNQDAYWCRFELPQGLELKKEYDPETDSFEYVKNGSFFVVTDAVTNAFSNLPLLRNFAKVSVESTTPQLVLNTSTTMAVINKPRFGSVAPSLATGGFVQDYYTQQYSYLKEHYDGFSPFDTDLVNSDPDQVTFLPCTVSGGIVSGGDFMYERPRITKNPSYLLIHGMYYPLKEGKTLADWKNATDPNNRYPNNPSNWLESSGIDGYYKIDFMDEDGYYAIFRNFRYHIRITGVSKAGAQTPGAAGSTGGTGDISSSTEAQGLTDISDGYGRIAVSYVEQTLVQQKNVIELKYKFISDAELGDQAINNKIKGKEDDGLVTITLGTVNGPVNIFANDFVYDTGNGDGVSSNPNDIILGDNSTGKVRVLAAETDAEGYRTIQFTTNSPSSQDRSVQTITISGQIDEHRSISREVTYYLMEKQNMTVSCVADEPNPDWGNNYVEEVAGAGVNVNITIPILLPESMFPLVFTLESDQLSITPNTAKYTTENLPVESGESICDGKTGKTTFHYVRTLSYSEYDSLPDNNGKTITCHFKTNKAQSASTIYVTNQYFNKGNAAFNNYKLYRFNSLNFSDYRAAANTPLNFTFNLDSEDQVPPARVVQVTLDGLVPQNKNAQGWGVIDEENGIYSYTIEAGRSATLAVKTITTGAGFDGSYAVTLNAYETGGSKAIYHEAEMYNLDYNFATLNINNNNYQKDNITVNEVTFAFDNVTGGGNNNNRYKQFGSNDYVWEGWTPSRVYESGNVSITAPTGYNITSIAITYTENNYSRQTVTYSPAGTSSDKNNWVGSSQNVTITMDTSSSNSTFNRVKAIAVTCKRI